MIWDSSKRSHSRYKFYLLKPLLLWAGLLLAGVEALAQPSSSSRAVVYPVPAPGEASRFGVPQVRLPNAAVARRINRLLLQSVLDEEDVTVNTHASPQRQLYQAARECCYDADTRTWAAAGGGLTGSEYHVLLNRGGLLSLSLTKQYTGNNHSYSTEHITFDLRTGRRLTLADLLADSPAQLGRRMVAAIDRRLWDELGNVAAIYGDSTRIADVAQMYGLYEWNTPHGRATASGNSAGSQAQWAELADFALTPTAVLLFYDVGVLRLNAEFSPDSRYVFPYERLHLRGLLLNLVKTRGVKKQ